MMRKNILLGLVAALFLPIFINAAETKLKKPVILVVEFGHQIDDFVNIVEKLAGSNIDVKNRDLEDVTAEDAREAYWVLVTGDMPQIDLDRILLLDPEILQKLDKALIVIKSRDAEGLIIHPWLNDVFRKIFQLRYMYTKTGRVIINDGMFGAFETWFKEEVLKLIPAGASSQKTGEVNLQLQQRISKFDIDLTRVNTEVQRLNKELAEIQRQLRKQ